MPNHPDEKTFQRSVISFFKYNLKYEHKESPALFDEKLREGYTDFLLKPILKERLQAINREVSEEQIDEAIFEIEKITDNDLFLANKKFHELTVKGIDTYNKKSDSYQKVFLFDKNNPLNNHFLIAPEFRCKGSSPEAKSKQPDLVVFINGISISVIELKNPYGTQSASIARAFNQIRTYQNEVPELFITNAFNCISNNANNGVGTITSNLDRYVEFKDDSGSSSFKNHFGGLYAKKNLIKIIHDYIIFMSDGQKIIAGYHQFFAVEKIISKSLLVEKEKKSKVGTVWHTTGSGKSFIMVFYVKQLLEKLKPLVIILTDRIDLDDQLYNTFARSKEFLNVDLSLKQIRSRDNLIELLDKNKKSEIIFTTIQKFSRDEKNLTFEELSSRDDIYIIADEAHRSQYSLMEGFAKNLRLALPKAKFVGFTGTPIELEGKNTKLIFGDYIDKYVMSRAIKDKTIVPLHYEARLAQINLNRKELKEIDKESEEIFGLHEVEEKGKRYLKMEGIIGDEKRLRLMAGDFVAHFEKRFENIFGKAMFCCYSRKVAVTFHEILQGLKPDWFSKDDTRGRVKLVMSGSSSDEVNFQKHIRTKEGVKAIEKRFKNPDDDLNIVIVANMWLTGFDNPCLNTMYIDKPLKGHNLIQAISRVNRVYLNKESGLIVDYIGIGEFLKKALYHFSDSDRREIKTDTPEVIRKMMNHYELTKLCFASFDYSNYFKTIDKEVKNNIIRDGMDTVLDKDNKQVFLLNSLKLLKAYSLCPLSPEAKEIVDEINFFKIVRNGLAQIDRTPTTEKNTVDLAKLISELISRATQTKGVIDIYDFVGEDKPDISILSGEFLAGVQKLKQKNLAYELLKKVLNDTIKLIEKSNIVLGKKFREKLEELISNYQNRTIDSAEVIKEMLKLAKDINKNEADTKKLGLNEDEIKFYSAVAQINDEKEVMKVDVLKSLAKELVHTVRQNKTIDWEKRENTRARMRRIIKQLLKKYNYPPEELEGAGDLVIRQAEVYAEGLN